MAKPSHLRIVADDAPEASVYAPPLSPAAKAEIASVAALARRLERLASGSFVTHASRAQIPETLAEIGRAALRAGKAVRT